MYTLIVGTQAMVFRSLHQVAEYARVHRIPGDSVIVLPTSIMITVREAHDRWVETKVGTKATAAERTNAGIPAC